MGILKTGEAVILIRSTPDPDPHSESEIYKYGSETLQDPVTLCRCS